VLAIREEVGVREALKLLELCGHGFESLPQLRSIAAVPAYP
jgi:hypothetical protein